MKLIKLRLLAYSIRGKFWLATKKKQVYYCPYCKQQTQGRILRNGLFTEHCRRCNRVFLAMATDGGKRARAVHHPKCDHGCGFHEPFGWVISADCPLHDEIPGVVR